MIKSLGFDRASKLLVQPPLAVRLDEAGDQRGRRRELHHVSGQDCLPPEVPGGAGAHIDMPATPERLWRACRQAASARR
jgi:hypothetical protein